MDAIMTGRGVNSLPARARGDGAHAAMLRAGAAFANPIRRLSAALVAFFDALGEARQRAYERRLLAEMDERMCRDIGVSPAGSPFDQVDPSMHHYWRAPCEARPQAEPE